MMELLAQNNLDFVKGAEKHDQIVDSIVGGKVNARRYFGVPLAHSEGVGWRA